jgi:hypothetical protein
MCCNQLEGVDQKCLEGGAEVEKWGQYNKKGDPCGGGLQPRGVTRSATSGRRPTGDRCPVARVATSGHPLAEPVCTDKLCPPYKLHFFWAFLH